MSDIIVKFKPQGHKKLIEAINQLKLAQNGAAGATDKFNKSAGRNRKTMSIFENSMSTIRSKLLVYNFAMGMGIKQTVEFAKQAAKVQDMSRAFTTLSGTGENAALSVSKISNAVKGTMSQMDLFKQANNAMILGVTRNTDEMAEMFQIAQTLGAALGVDTPQAVESLITGIGRQSRLMLDNIGIIVKADEAYKAYADGLGITTDKLTDAQKKQAFFTAAMESARTKAAELGNQQLTARDQFNKFNATISDFTNFIGEKTSPIVLSFFNSFGETLKRFTETDLETTVRQLSEMGVAAEHMAILQKALNVEQAIKQLENSESQIMFTMRGIAEQFMKEEGIAELAFANDEQIKRVRDRLRILGVDFDVMKHRLEADFTLDVENLNLEMIDKSLETINTSIDTSTGNFKDMNEGQKKLFMSMIKDYNTLLPLLNAIKTETDKTAQANKILSGTNEEVTDTNNETTTSTNILTDALNNAFIAANKRIETIKEEIKLNKQLLDSSFALGKGYKNAGNAGIAAAHAVISAKIQEAVINYMAKAMVGLSFPANLIVPALGAAMAGSLGSVLGNMKLPQFEQGGYVGGRPHSQGGTIIEAERGEFVMSRNATESIGLETLNQMNQTGGGAVNVSVTGNVLTQDFVEGELAESIKEAIRRGTDFGIDDHFHFFGKGVR